MTNSGSSQRRDGEVVTFAQLRGRDSEPQVAARPGPEPDAGTSLPEDEQVVTFGELTAGRERAREQIDPRDVAARAAKPAAPYTGAIGAQNLQQPVIPGSAGVPGSSLSDGMAEAANFFARLDEENRLRTRPRPPGAGIMWEGYGQFQEPDLAPRIKQEPLPQIVGLPDATPSERTAQKVFGMRGIPPAVAAVPRSIGAGLADIGGAAWGGVRAAADIAGMETLSKIAGESAKAAEEFARGIPEPPLDAPVARFLQTGIRGATAMAPALAVGAAYGPVAGLTTLFAQSFGSDYQDGIERGLPPGDAFLRATATSATEVATEIIPFHKAMKLGKAATTGSVRDALRKAGELIAAEIPSEQVNTIARYLIDKVPGIGINPDASIDELREQLAETFYQTAAQSLVLSAVGVGGAGAARAAGIRPMPAQEIQKPPAFEKEVAPSKEAAEAVAEMRRQQEEAAKRTAAAKEGQPVAPTERWETAKRAFAEEKTDGGVVYVAPNGARITPDMWDNASERVRAAWLKEAPKQEKPPEKPKPTPEQILRMKPDENIVARPAKLRSETLDKLREEYRQAQSPIVKQKIAKQIAAEEARIERMLAAEEIAAQAEQEQDPEMKALRWNAAANLVVKKPTPEELGKPEMKGIKVEEIDLEKLGEPEKQAPATRGIKVKELTEEEASQLLETPEQKKARQQQEEAFAEVESLRQKAIEAEHVEPDEQPPRGSEIIGHIRRARQEVDGLTAELKRVGNSPAASVVKSRLSKASRRLKDLVTAYELNAEAQKTKDKELADQMAKKAAELLEKSAPKTPKKVVKAEESEEEIQKISQSPLIRAIWRNSRGRGIEQSLLGDIGLEEPTFKKEVRVVTKSGKVVTKVIPRKIRFRVEFGKGGELFKKGGVQEDGIIEAMVQYGYLPSEEYMAAHPEVNWTQEALERVRQELESPGSVKTWSFEEGIEEYERQQEEERRAQVMEDAEAFGISTRGKKFEEIERAVRDAYASDWTAVAGNQIAEYERWKEQTGLDDRQLAMAALAKRAAEIDADAVERAAVTFADDDAAFMREVRRIIEEGTGSAKSEQAVQGRADDAGAAVQELEGVERGREATPPDTEGGIVPGEAAAGRGEAAGAGRAASDVEAAQEPAGLGTERGAEAGRAADVGRTEAEPQPRAAAAGGGESLSLAQLGRSIPTAPSEGHRFLEETSSRLSQRFGRNVSIALADGNDPALGEDRIRAHKFWSDFMRLSGGRIRFFRHLGDAVFDGFVSERDPNTLWLSVTSTNPAMAIAGHEFGHWLEQNHPELHEQFFRSIAKELRDVNEHYRLLASDYARAGDASLDPRQAARELISDIWGDLFTDPKLHEALAARNPSLYRRLANAFIDFIDWLVERFSGKGYSPLGSKRYVNDLVKVRRAAVDVLAKLADKNAQALQLEQAIIEAQARFMGAPAFGLKQGDALSIARAVAPPESDVVTLPEERTVERILFDSFSRVAQLEAEYERATGKALPDEQSVRLMEKLFHGRVQHRVNEFDKKFVQPLAKELKKLKKLGLSIKDFDDYLIALHAPERNATLAARDPEGRTGLSGYTDEQAAEIIAGFSQEQIAAMEPARKIVRQIVEYNLDSLVDAGLVKKETADFLRQRWPNYVPLKTLNVERRETGTGVGFEMWATDIHAAFGRTSRASTPTGFAISDAARTIVRAEKARVEKAIWSLAQKPELAGIIQEFDPKNPPPEVMRKELVDGEVKERIDFGKMQEHVMTLVIDGEQRRVFVGDEMLMRALRRAGEFENIDAFLRGIGHVTRTIGRTLTEWNPSWFFPNAVKDGISASIRALGIEGISSGDLVAEIPKSWKQIVDYKLGRFTDGAKLYEEFSAAGGITGAYGMRTADEIVEDLVRRGAKSGYLYGEPSVASMALDVPRAVLHAISTANEVMEYATRFAAYKVARKAGYSVDRAAEIAKEITVNFNRRGEISRAAGSLFIFFNASLQGLFGTIAFFGMSPDSVIKRGALSRNKVIAGAAALAAAGAVMQFVNETLGGDDEASGEKNVNMHSDFVLDKNVSLTVGDRISKVPLPPEYSAFYAFGRRIYRALSQGNYRREAAGIASNLLDATMPVRFSDDTSAPLAVYKAFTPTAILPVAEVLLDSNFLGASIVPKQIGTGPPEPYHRLSRPGTSDLAKAISSTLNAATGGTDTRPGWAQKVLGPIVSPEGIEHMARQYTGGLGQLVTQSVNIAKAAAGQKQAVELSRLPVTSRFYAEKPTSYVERKYREIADEVQYLKRQRRRGEPTESYQAKAVEFAYDSAERRLRALYQSFREADARDDEARKEDIRKQIVAEKARVLRAYNAAGAASGR